MKFSAEAENNEDFTEEIKSVIKTIAQLCSEIKYILYEI